MHEKLRALLQLGQLQIQAGGLMMQSESVKASGDYRAARDSYAEYIATLDSLLGASLEHNERFPDSPFELTSTANMLVNALMVAADVTQALGEREEAEGMRQRALATSREYLGRTGTAETERARASSLLLEGRFNEAIVALLGARDLVMEQEDPLEMSRVTLDLADLLQWLGDFRRAKEELLHAEALIRPFLTERKPTKSDVFTDLLSDFSSILSGGGNSGKAMQTMQLYRSSNEVTYFHGLVSRALGEWDEAERCMAEVLPEYRKLGSGEAIEYQQAMIQVGRGRYREALEQLQRLAPVFETGAFRPKRGVLQRALAECLHALGETAPALQLVDESIADLTEAHFDPDALWRSQWQRAKLCSDAGRAEECVDALRDTVETLAGLRRAPLGYRLDSTFLADKLEVFAQAVQATLTAGDLQSCCVFMDSIKSRTLSAVLSIPAPADGRASGQEDELERVTQQLDVLEYQAYREGWTADRKRTRADLLRRRTTVLERIRVSDPRWRALSEPVALDVDRLASTLAGRGQAALSLYLDGQRIHAVLLVDGELSGASVDLSPEVFGKLEDYAKNLQKKRVNVFKHDLSAEYSVRAEHLVPAALLERAVGARSLVVVPHGLLHLVPWSGLIHDGRRLFEALPVGVLPNLAALLQDEPAVAPARVALVGVGSYGDADRLADLPSSLEEIANLERIYDRDQIAGKLVDEQATESNFWKLARGIDGAGNVLHVSCHGTIVPNEPMSSGLLLYDSKIDAAEVARADLHFDEVVLSACWTGWRPTEVEDVVLASDEVLGIPGGFLEARARTVLTSIPMGEGATARDLTSHYHARRRAGESPLFAYRSAQLHMLDREGVKPALWIGFTLYGCQ